MDKKDAAAYEFGDFRLDTSDGRLERGGEEIPLTPTLLGILETLIEHAGHIVSRQQFMERVWSGRIVEDGNLARNVSSLRKLLGDDAQNPRFIETVPRRGYRFVANVVPRSADPIPPIVGQRRRRISRRLFATGSLSALAAAGGVMAVAKIGGGHRAGPIRSLVVLPIENLSGEPTQDFFADGMTSELITSLGMIKSLSVTSRTSSMQYKGTTQRLPEIADELGVEGIVEASVLRASDDSVRLTIRLVDAADDRSVWTSIYEAPAREVPALHREITLEIAREAGVTVMPDEMHRLSAARPVDKDAHEAYLLGRFFRNSGTVEGLHKAIDYFQQAIALDSGYARPHAAMADTWLRLASWHGPSRNLWQRARSAARAALAIDPNDAEAQMVIAGALLCHDLEPAAAEPEFRRAVDLNPSSSLIVLRYAYGLMALGRYEESLRVVRRSVELDPVSAHPLAMLGKILHIAGRHEEAVAQLEHALALHAGNPEVHRILGGVLLATGDLQRAAATLEEALRLGHGHGVVGELGYTYALAGRTDDARAQLHKLEAMAREGRDSAFSIALIHYGFGERAQTFEWLGKAYAERDFRMILLRIDPIWDDLRTEPRFTELLETIGLEAHRSA